MRVFPQLTRAQFREKLLAECDLTSDELDAAGTIIVHCDCGGEGCTGWQILCITGSVVSDVIGAYADGRRFERYKVKAAGGDEVVGRLDVFIDPPPDAEPKHIHADVTYPSVTFTAYPTQQAAA